MISQIYGKVNDSNKKKMEKSNISTLVDLAQKESSSTPSRHSPTGRRAHFGSNAREQSLVAIQNSQVDA